MIDTNLIKSLKFSFIDKYVGYFFRFFSTIVLARLITPEEVGIFSIAFVIISFAHILRDFGLAQYLVKVPEFNFQDIRTAFTLMLTISWSIFFILIFSSDYISFFFNNSEIKDVIFILSFIFFIAPFGTIRIALLRREMKFSELAKINISSYIVLNLITIILACNNYGPKALAWGQLSGVIAVNIGAYILYRLPIIYPTFKSSSKIIKFGTSISITNFIETISHHSSDLIIGRFLGLTHVGYFGKAFSLINLFKTLVTSAVWPIVLPYFSHKQRNKIFSSKDYGAVIDYYCIFALPFYGMIFLFPEMIIEILFGHQWIIISDFIQWLCLGAMFSAFLPFIPPLLISKGLENINLILQLFKMTLLIILGLISINYGLIGYAKSYALCEFITFLVTVNILSKFKIIKLSIIFASLRDALKISLTIFFASYFLIKLPVNNILIKFIFISFSITLLWLFHIFRMNHPLLKIFLPIMNKGQ